MKLFHTADWHLGKLVHGVYMTEDQRYVLEQFIDAVREEKPDAVILAGDIYDRGVPPVEAVELLDWALAQIVLELGTPVLAISGNHDSPDRIAFGSRFMESRGLHLAGGYTGEIKPVVLRDEYGEVFVHLAPYADPGQVRHALGDDGIRTHQDAMAAITAKINENRDPSARHVLVGHAFVTPAGESMPNTSDSERPLSIGGAEHVSAALFSSFHYTALGHLHGAHYVLNENIRYSGSPLKYSISEENHEKGYLIVEMDGSGVSSVQKRPLLPRRNMRRVEASIEELERHPVNDDYVFVTLLNDAPVLFPMEKVRAVYPNALHVDRRMAQGANQEGQSSVSEANAAKRSQSEPVDLFAGFYQEVKGVPLTEERKELFSNMLDSLLKEEGAGA
ncbi:exonuclease SbcCD subunit D [Paenibacillus sp. CAU 1782]